ncbi:MAG: phospholipase D-like domain-containing protein, partial [Pseudomonadota bacterium]|nr:phospholipase D-like domain-containing protein [Pseudomonadota bacterium]
GKPKKHLGGSGVGGSSAASLHAKTFAVDRDRIFVGSFNFDPRSAKLNTELGFVIESPAISAQMAGVFDDEIAQHAYEVRLEPGDRMVWIEHTEAGPVRHDHEPGTSFVKRCWVILLSGLPIEWLL